jgi:hypothetical protein
MLLELTKAIPPIVVAVMMSVIASDQMILPEPNGEVEWTIEIVDPYVYQGQRTRLAIDSNGYPHISYDDDTYTELKYARWNGSAWNIETLDPFGYNVFSSIDLDCNDYPHIAYHTGNELKYARWNGSTWNITTLSDTFVLGFPSIVIDNLDYPHIAWRHDQKDLIYTYWNGSEWVSEYVDSPISHDVSLVLDRHGYPHLAYHARARLHYAKWNGSAWNIGIPDSVTETGFISSVSLVLDSRGYPHIAYHEHPTELLKYAEWNGSAWSVQTIDPLGIGYDSSIALDKNDYPHISYRGLPSTRYAKWNGTDWEIEVIEDVIGFGSSIALDQNDVPHISYSDYFNRNLKYAKKAYLAPWRSVSLNIDPDTLNLKSLGRWITAYLTTENATVEDIDPTSLLLNEVIRPEWWGIQNDTTLMVKFSRSAMQAIVPVSDEVDIKVTGQWKDGEGFELHNIIRVIDPGGYRVAHQIFSSREIPISHFRENSDVFPPIGKPMEGLRVQFQSLKGQICVLEKLTQIT